MIRVIVADDEQKVCRLICQLIDWDGLGMRLLGTAVNGVDALGLIQKHKPDLVITDIKMPGCDGLELLERSQEEDFRPEFIIISGYSHFEYAQTAIRYGVKDYILKPINKDLLNATLQKVRHRYLERQDRAAAAEIFEARQKEDKKRLRSTFWPDFELGRAPASIEEINQKYMFSFRPGVFRVFMVQADVKDNCTLDESFVSNVVELCYTKTSALTVEYVAAFSFEIETFSENGRVIGIVNYSAESGRQVREAFSFFVSRLCVELHVFSSMQFHLSFSEEFENFSGLKKAALKAELAMGQRLFERGAMILEEIPPEIEFKPDALYRQFGAAIAHVYDTLSPRQIEEAVDALKQSVMLSMFNGTQLIRTAIECYRLFLLSGLFQQGKGTSARETEADFERKALLCSSADNLFEFLKEACKRDLERARRIIETDKTMPIVRAKQYINANFSHPLGLEDVSSAVGFNSSYFSTLFRKETGVTFLEYLTEVRIDKAKSLLRESRATVEEVGRTVGCSDTKRFSKTFRKLVGVTPKEYRNLYS